MSHRLRFIILQACLAAMLAVAFDSHARAAQLIGTGVRSGVTIAHFHGASSDALGRDYRTGFATSLHTRVRLGSWISLRPELGWVAKGGASHVRITVASPSEPPFVFQATSKSRLDYIELPILVQIDLAAPGPLDPYLIVGPMVSWNVHETRRSEVMPPQSAAASIQMSRIFEEVGTFDSDLGVRSFDAGSVAGLGVMWSRGATRFGLEGRYTHGFTNLLPGRSTLDGSEVQLQNGAFAITALVES